MTKTVYIICFLLQCSALDYGEMQGEAYFDAIQV